MFTATHSRPTHRSNCCDKDFLEAVFILLSNTYSTLIVQATCMGPLLPTISTLRTWLSARASKAGWVMSVVCRKTGEILYYSLLKTGYLRGCRVDKRLFFIFAASSDAACPQLCEAFGFVDKNVPLVALFVCLKVMSQSHKPVVLLLIPNKTLHTATLLLTSF